MRKQIRLFWIFNFFSFRVLFSKPCEFLQNILNIKKIKLRGKDIKFYTPSEMSIVRAVLFGKKEKEVYDFIDRYLNKDDLFFDIGANVGVFSIYSSIFRDANCIAFEPEFANLYLLKKNIILNNLTTKVNVYPCSINNQNGLSFLHLSSLESGSALHSISNENIKTTDENASVVMKTGTYNLTIDEFVNQTKKIPKMIKIDTDGKELEILKGAHETLKHVSYIALEMPINSDKEKTCLEILDKNNFKIIKDLEKGRNFFFKKNNK
jgi:FkbM family methyltransferase